MIFIKYLMIGALLLSQAPEFELKQSKAILGEPVLIEIKGVKEENWGIYPIEIEIDGGGYNCIVLNEVWKIPRSYINIIDYLKYPGEYEINIAEDEMYWCAGKLWEYDEKMKELGEKPIYKKFKERLKDKDKELKILASFKIKIDEPIDYDRRAYLSILKEESSMEGFWEGSYDGKFKEFIEETIKHPESNYFPWAVYIYFSRKRGFDETAYKYILNEEAIKEIFSHKDMIKIADEKTSAKLKEAIFLIDEIEKRYKEFQFLPKLMLSRIATGIVLNEEKSILIDKAKLLKDIGGEEEKKKADLIINFLEKEKKNL